MYMYKEQSIAREDDKLSHLDVDFFEVFVYLVKQ